MIFAASENHEYVIELLLRQEDIDVNMEDTFKLKTFILFKSDIFHVNSK